MVDTDNVLKEVLKTIAKEEELDNYETDLTSIQSEGANFTSQLYTVILSTPGKENLNLFAKVAMMGETFRKSTNLQIFETEINFYTKVVPKYRELEKRYKFPKENCLVLPKYYGGSTEYMKETLVLENLSVKGYQPFDRFKCFDWEYALQCVTVLARLHALSVVFLQEEPELFPAQVQDPENFPPDEMKVVMEKSIANALEVTEEEHRGKLAKFFAENMTVEAFTSFYNPERKIVLNHGDFRPSNVLHKRDENGNLEIVLVDFQIIQKSNPVVDLVYFLICGSDEEFREKYRQQYFDRYYEEFVVTLRQLEIYPDGVYSKRDFDADVKKLLPFGLILGAMALPIITVDSASAPKLEGGIEIKNFAVETNNLFRTRFNGLVNDYVKWGYLGSNDNPPLEKPPTKSPCCTLL